MMLIRYIKKSNLIKLLNHFDPKELGENHQENLTALVKALQEADIHHPIFTNENCEFYLTYLYLTHLYLNNQLIHEAGETDLNGFLATMERNKDLEMPSINKDDFLQAYLYLMGLNDYNKNMVVLKNSDISASNKLSLYADHLHENYPNLPEEVIREKIAELSGIHSIFLAIKKNAVDRLLNVLIRPGGLADASGTPIAAICDQETYVIIPPIALITWLTHEFKPSNPIEMEPIFGSIGTETLYSDFHQHSKRPVSLPSKHVKSSLKIAHELASSNLSVPLHDSHYHYVALSLFPTSAFRFLVDVLLPELKKLTRYDDTTDAAEQKKDISDLFDLLNDFATPSDKKNYQINLTDHEILVGYLFTHYLSNASNFYISLILMQTLLTNEVQIPQKRLIQQMINQIYDPADNTNYNFTAIIPKLIACGKPHAINVFFSLTDLLNNPSLPAEFDINLLFKYKEYALEIKAALNLLLNKNPSAVLDNRILKIITENAAFSPKIAKILATLFKNNITLEDNLLSVIARNAHKNFPSALFLALYKEHPNAFNQPVIIDYLLSNPDRAPYLIKTLTNFQKIHPDAHTAIQLIEEKCEEIAERLSKQVNDKVADDDFYFGESNPFRRCADSTYFMRNKDEAGMIARSLHNHKTEVKTAIKDLCFTLYSYHNSNIEFYANKYEDLFCSATFLTLFQQLFKKNHIFPQDMLDKLSDYGASNQHDYIDLILSTHRRLNINPKLSTNDLMSGIEEILDVDLRQSLRPK